MYGIGNFRIKRLHDWMKYLEVLSRDKKLSAILALVSPYKPRRQTDIYFRLMRAIAGQQLSVKAAATIWDRYLNLFPDKYPHPELVVVTNPEMMRAAGLSYQKAGYMKAIASFSATNDISYEYLKKLSDDEIVAYLSQIKGVGKWTVEMLLMFCFGRKDVFPVDDLGIVNAMKKLYGLKLEGRELKGRCIRIAEKWRPYRSHACFYLWPYKDFTNGS